MNKLVWPIINSIEQVEL